MPGGQPTKYTPELAAKICEDITCKMTIKEACKNNNIDETTYYNWLREHKQFFQLSAEARQTKAYKFFDLCEEAIRKVENDTYDAGKGRVIFDSYLRLAGKANQGVFGNIEANKQEGTVINIIDKSKDYEVNKKIN